MVGMRPIPLKRLHLRKVSVVLGLTLSAATAHAEPERAMTFQVGGQTAQMPYPDGFCPLKPKGASIARKLVAPPMSPSLLAVAESCDARRDRVTTLNVLDLNLGTDLPATKEALLAKMYASLSADESSEVGDLEALTANRYHGATGDTLNFDMAFEHPLRDADCVYLSARTKAAHDGGDPLEVLSTTCITLSNGRVLQIGLNQVGDGLSIKQLIEKVHSLSNSITFE
jgi:hypothetical protein